MPVARRPSVNGQASPSPERDSSGQCDGRPSRLACLIARTLEDTHPDHVEIGRADYLPAPVDETASWADLAEANGRVRYLLRHWIPYDMLTGVVGDSKVGKSYFLLWAVVRPIITGCGWFSDQLGADPGYVVWCDTERRAAINLERATRWGLPVERIVTPFGDKYAMLDMGDPAHIRRLTDVVCRYQARGVILDSVRGAHRGDENSSKMDAALKDLGSICETTHTACLVIHHTKKTRIEGEEAGGEPTLHCARGSSAFLAAVACQLVIDIPDPRPNLKSAWRRLQVLGENLGVAPAPVGFRIHDDRLEFGPAPRRAEREKQETGKDRAEQWLAARMRSGIWYPAGDITEEAEAAGFAKTGTLQRAKAALGVRTRKNGKGWEWCREGITDPSGDT